MCVRFGTSSKPSRIKGLVVFRAEARWSCVLRITELGLTGACFNSGTTTGVSKLPIRPSALSRSTSFTVKRPGGSVTPVP